MKRIATLVAGALVTTGLNAAPVKSPAWELVYANTAVGFEFLDANNIERQGDVAAGWLLIRTPKIILKGLAPEAKPLYKQAQKHQNLSAVDTDKLKKALEKAVENDEATSRLFVNCKTNQYSNDEEPWDDIKPGSDVMRLFYRLCGTGQ